MSHPITSEEMTDAIEGLGVQISQENLNDLLQAIQEDIEDLWKEHMDAIEKGELEFVDETDEALIFADHDGYFWRDQFDAVIEFINLLGAADEGAPETILAAHHNAAYRLTDHNWATANPVVVGKPDEFDGGEIFVEAVVNSLMARGLSPGQAWAYYGVILQENSRNKWAERCGYTDHSTISEAVRKAKDKLED